ncbi:hypothetical protein JKF63_01819 [Porcisia hertigi]|uniref:Uncharacterized protein n=1 Tax=Porcisia hertigi TaxID=2761500 RepID=A0A836L0F9_9TRYP|nr:hypothetical protein JKF63_01819 [Porcisia hertigi]
MPSHPKSQASKHDARNTMKKKAPQSASVTRGDASVETLNSAASLPAATGSVASNSTPKGVAVLSTSEQERAVEAIKMTVSAVSSREELRKDSIYRIMHALPRSDMLEVVRSRFAKTHCERAAAYFDLSYMKNPLRHLRLQIGCDGPTGIHLFFNRIAAHRHTLRVVDFSRNRLGADDVVLLCNTLGLGSAGDAAAAMITAKSPPACIAVASTTSTTTEAPVGQSSSLELLDLSYNAKIGNDGAVHVVRALRRCPSIRAVIMKSVGLDDDCAGIIADVLRGWPAPPLHAHPTSTHALLRPASASATKFYLNLNENYIGARGTQVLGKGLPDHVSLTLVKQRVAPARDLKRWREDNGDTCR